MKRFWDKVNKTETCWLWTASTKGKNNYGSFWDGNKSTYAHRVSWELHNGEIPNDLRVLHKCDTPECIRPDHLFLGTQADNILDQMQKNRKGKLKKNQVIQIRKMYKPYVVTLYDLAKQFKVCPKTIHKIVTGVTWKHI